MKIGLFTPSGSGHLNPALALAKELTRLHKRAVIVRSAPQLEILQRADAFITHAARRVTNLGAVTVAP